MDQQKQAFNPLLACLAALAALFFVFPLIGMITGAPWGNVFGIITSKSSLDALGLSIIASLASTVIALLLAGGQVVLDGTVLEDPAQHIKVPPENRPIGLMFQDYLLFPHLSAVENVAFGLRAEGTDKKTARDRATQALARLGLEGALASAARARCPAASNSAWPWPAPW